MYREEVLEYNHREVKVLFLKDVPRIEAGRWRVGPFNEGNEAKLPRWLASVFEREGVARILNEEKLTPQDLSKLLWREEHTPKIIRIDPDFYVKLSEYLRALSEAGKDPEALHERRQALNRVLDLLKLRMQKIVQAALSASIPTDFLEALTPEEKLLLENVRDEIEKWRRSIIKSYRG